MICPNKESPLWINVSFWRSAATSDLPAILLQKSFWGGERKFLEPLRRFTRGDVRDHIVSSKIDHQPLWRVEKRRSSREVQRSTFARFSGSLDFRLLQQYLPNNGLRSRSKWHHQSPRQHA